MALGQVCLLVLSFTNVRVIPPVLYSRIYFVYHRHCVGHLSIESGVK